MGGKAAPDLQLRRDFLEVIGIPVLVCVAENKVERTLQYFNQIMGVSKPGIDILRKAGFLEIFKRLFIPSFINFNGDEFASGFAQRPRDPDG